MDLDEQDFYGSNDVTDEHVAAFERDYYIALEDHSIGRVFRYLGIYKRMAILMIIGVQIPLAALHQILLAFPCLGILVHCALLMRRRLHILDAVVQL